MMVLNFMVEVELRRKEGFRVLGVVEVNFRGWY